MANLSNLLPFILCGRALGPLTLPQALTLGEPRLELKDLLVRLLALLAQRIRILLHLDQSILVLLVDLEPACTTPRVNRLQRQS